MPSDYRHAGEAPVPVRSKTAPERRVSRAVSSDWSDRASGGCNIKGNRTGRAGGSTACPAAPLRPDPGVGGLLHRGGGQGGGLPAGDRQVNAFRIELSSSAGRTQENASRCVNRRSLLP
jgi:hypothetical protein